MVKPPGAREIIVLAHVSWALVALLSARPAFATCIMAVIHTDRILLAADSNIGSSPHFHKDCKINLAPNCIFMMKGTYHYTGLIPNGPSVDFDATKCAIEACSGVEDLKSKADTFLKLIHGPSEKAVQFIQRYDRKYYNDIVAPGKADFVSALFAGIQGGRLSVFGRGVWVNDNDQIADEPAQDYDSSNPTFVDGCSPRS